MTFGRLIAQLLALRKPPPLLALSVVAIVSVSGLVLLRHRISGKPRADVEEIPRISYQPTLSPTDLEPGYGRTIDDLCRFRPDIQDVASQFHLIRVWAGPGHNSPQERATARRQLSALLHQDLFRETYRTAFPFIVATRYGARFAERDRFASRGEIPFRESHIALTLSVLGEVGVPLNTPLGTPERTLTLRSALDDLIANFTLEMEQDWGTVALAFYLPPQNTWRNKFGDVFSFDQQLNMLAGRSAGRGSSCAGTHTLYTLAILCAVDRQIPILSGASRVKAKLVLDTARAHLERSQLPSGAWDINWADDERPESLNAARQWSSAREVLVTGHHLEWLATVPAEMRIVKPGLCRAANFIVRKAALCDHRSFFENVCPYSHGVRAIHLLVANQCDVFHFWSLHSGGANFLFCDGSVHFIHYDAAPIMSALASRAGGEAVSVPD